jgi:hypothetical protein
MLLFNTSSFFFHIGGFSFPFKKKWLGVKKLSHIYNVFFQAIGMNFKQNIYSTLELLLLLYLKIGPLWRAQPF